MRTSHSQSSTYVACPKFWDLSYNDKWKSPVEGASLFFGSAVDTVVMGLLTNKVKPEDCAAEFNKRWAKLTKNGELIDIFDNDTIVYANSDFDEDVLKPEDKQYLAAWSIELKLDSLGGSPIDGIKVYKEVAKIKSNPYKTTQPEHLKFFNRASWLSLKRKGEILVEAFLLQFYPKIKKVHAVQKYGKIVDNGTGDTISGYIDMILEIEGYDKPIIFDLKTAGRPYDEEQIKLTEQLTLYCAMEGGNFNTDLVGYVVLSKLIHKETTANCKSCNHLKTGRHQTCDNEINGKRCGGEWNEITIPKPIVQVLVERKTPEQVQALLNDQANIIMAMKNKIIYKNTSKCNNWYGGQCVYYNACHNNDFSGLKNTKTDEDKLLDNIKP